MKRHGDLYAKIYDFANIESAYRKARKCRRYRNEVLRYTARLEENMINLQNHLMWKSYAQGEKRIFTVTEPKTRLITALPFRDRVAQHAINNILEPLYDKRFYYHSYACRPGKGTHNASYQLRTWVKNLSYDGKPLYALQVDIKSYFASVNHDILKKMLRRVIKDPDVLWLMDHIIDNGNENGRGIPVGNLTSQLLANVYLDALDKYIKETLKVKYYIRYMDDFIILSHDKKELKRLFALIRRFLENELDLTINPKSAIFNTKNGVDFCGYRHFKTHTKIRKRSVKKMRRMIRAYKNGVISREKFIRIVMSWFGHIQHADTYTIKNKMIREIKANKRNC